MKKWILCYWCHPTGLMSPLANLNEHFNTPSHYSLKECQLLASVMGAVPHPAVTEAESARACAAAPAFCVGITQSSCLFSLSQRNIH